MSLFKDVPLTFPEAPKELKRDLERLSNSVFNFGKEALNILAPRWQPQAQAASALSFDLSIPFTPKTGETINVSLPRPDSKNGGRICGLVRKTSNGTIKVRAIGCTVDGLTSYTVPQGRGFTAFFFDGVNYWTSRPATSGGPFPTFGTIASVHQVEHFLSVTQMQGLAASVSGTSATVINDDSDDENRMGIADFRTGTDATGRAALLSGSSGIRFGGGRHLLRWDLISAISDGTDTFVTRVGFLDSPSGDGTDGIYFRYTHSVNSGRWQAVTRSGATETASDTGVAQTIAYFTFEIEVNAAATSVAFFINGTLVATNTANIPSGSNLTGIGASIVKSAGTNLREVKADLMIYTFEPTTLL